MINLLGYLNCDICSQPKVKFFFVSAMMWRSEVFLFPFFSLSEILTNICVVNILCLKLMPDISDIEIDIPIYLGKIRRPLYDTDTKYGEPGDWVLVLGLLWHHLCRHKYVSEQFCNCDLTDITEVRWPKMFFKALFS